MSLAGQIPESWDCVDCGVNTAPGVPNRAEFEAAMRTAKARSKFTGEEAGVPIDITNKCEVYTVREKVWRAAGMGPMGGCLCVGCLEKRLGRALKPKDVERDHPFNALGFPGTPRLLERRLKSN
jgi:hypothetical protein